MLKHLLKAARRLDDHWLGDLLGILILSAGAYLLLLAGYGLEPQ